MGEFGEFLAASLTFTNCLKQIRVFVNQVERLCILKTLVQEPRPVAAPKTQSSSWWKSTTTDAILTTPNGVFSLSEKTAMYESVYRITVLMGTTNDSASIDARYISAVAQTNNGSDMARRMERVTKKQPPKHLTLQVFLNAQSPS